MSVETKTGPKVEEKQGAMLVEKVVSCEAVVIEHEQHVKQKQKKRRSLDGVAYDRVQGASCPACRMNLGKMSGGSVTNTLPWEDGLRIRYHTCRRCGARFKSIESE